MQSNPILAFHWGDWPRPDPNGPQCGPLVELSKENKILVIESPITMLNPFLHPRNTKILPQLFVFTPLLLLPYHPRLPIPTWVKKILNKINNPLIYFQVKKRLKNLGISNPILWLSMLHPVELIDIFKPRLTCVLCYDEVSSSPIFTKSQQMLIKEFEEKLLKRANIVFTTSKRLYNNKIKINPKTYLIPNAVEKEFVDRVNMAMPDPLEKIKAPRIGYIGKINIRLDLELIYNTAQNRPDWNWIFIGPIEHGAGKRLKKIKNVHLLGKMGHFEIAKYLKHFDVLTIPFKINEYTKNMNPLKLYQYLASGKPIVSTNLPEITEFNNAYPGLVYTGSDFIKSIEEGLKENDAGLRKKRLDAAYDNTWDKRAQLISEIINENTPHI